MNKLPIFLLLLLFTTITISCSSDDNSSNLSNVEIIFTEGKARRIEMIPVDQNLEYEHVDELILEDVANTSFKLPNYTKHFYLKIRGNQKVIKGYVKINGNSKEFTTHDWYYQGTYYLSDFK